MNVSLIGFMGCGKSTVGALLSRSLAAVFIDLDEFIESESGSSIPIIFREGGESAFRKIETESLEKVVEGLSSKSNTVLACGGATPIYNKDMVQDNFLTVYLEASFETIKERIRDDSGRPLAKDAARLYEERVAPYEELADIKVTTDGKTPEEIADEIKHKIETL